jgi:hypothetical protein
LHNPSLGDIWRSIGTCLRLAKACHKKLNPPSRFKTIGTPEDRRRQFESDLARVYGDDSPAARLLSPSASTPAAP